MYVLVYHVENRELPRAQQSLGVRPTIYDLGLYMLRSIAQATYEA